MTCPNCGETLLHAPGIGDFCPNAACPVADGPDVWPNMAFTPVFDETLEIEIARARLKATQAVISAAEDVAGRWSLVRAANGELGSCGLVEALNRLSVALDQLYAEEEEG